MIPDQSSSGSSGESVGYAPEFLKTYDRLRAPFDVRRQFDNRHRVPRLIRRRRPWKSLLDDDPVREQRPAPLLELRAASVEDAETVTGMLEARSGSDPVAVLSRCEFRGEAAQPYVDATAFEALRRTEADVEALVGEWRGRTDGPHRRQARPLEFPRTESLLELFAVYGETHQEQRRKEGGEYADFHSGYRNPLVVAEALWKRAQKGREARKAVPERTGEEAERTGEEAEAAAPGRSGPRWVGGLARKALDGGVGLARAGYTGLYLGTSRLLRLLGADRKGTGLTFDRFDRWVVTPLGLLVNFLLGLSLLLGVPEIPGLETFPQILTVLGLLLLVLLRALAHLGLSRPWRPYRWLVRQPYLLDDADAPANHRAAAQHVGEAYRKLRIAHAEGNRQAFHDRARALRLLLVNAVLEDLAAAYPERYHYRTGFHRPVLVADRYATRWRGGADSSAHDADLVQLIERVRAEQYAPDPLVIVVVVPDPASLADRVTGSAGRELTAWTDRRRHVAHLGPSRTVSVDIGPDAEERARHRGQVRGPERTESATARRWRDAATAAGAGMAVLLLMMGTVAVLDLINKENKCWRPLLTDLGVWEAETDHRRRRDCVGYTDGSFVFHEDLKAFQELIEKQNSDIPAREPYVTVVYFGQLSVSDTKASNSRLAGVRGELRGLALRQQQHNESAHDKGVPRIRLLLANAGPDWEHGEAVAKQIGQRIRRENIVAAVGFGQSLEGTRKTIRVLSGYGLPMVSSTATYDRIAVLNAPEEGETKPEEDLYSDFFFPVAPSNTRLAGQTAEWVLNGKAGEGVENVLAVAYTTDSELYGEDLAEKFMKSFRGEGGSAEDNGVIEYDGDEMTLNRVVGQVCGNDLPPDLIYYAGRSADFGEFLYKLDSSSQCSGVTVLASDDIAQYIADKADELKESDISVYYTPLAMRDVVDKSSFYDGLDSVTDGSKAGSVSIAHAAMAYDAFTVVVTALEDAVDLLEDDPRRLRKFPPLLLPEIQGSEKLAGVSGELLFSADNGHWYDGKLVQLARVDEEGTPQLVAACGQITHQKKRGAEENGCLEQPETE